MKDEKLFLTVKGREGTLYQGNAQAITSFNDKGKFDVLTQHANFISLIKQNLTIIKPNGQPQEIKVDNGVMRVIKNQVEVYLGIKQ